MYVSYGATVHGPDMIGFTSETLRPQVIAEVLVRDYCIVAPPGVRLGETMELFSGVNWHRIDVESLFISYAVKTRFCSSHLPSVYRNRYCNIQNIASLQGSAGGSSLRLQSNAFTYKTASTGDPLGPTVHVPVPILTARCHQ